MPPSEHGPVYDAAALLLSLLASGYSEAGVTLPDRKYVTPGVVPAYDEPQLTVSVLAVRVGIIGTTIGAPIRECGNVRYVSLRAELVRCTPTVKESGAAPSAAELLTSAQEILRDLELVHSLTYASRGTLAGKGDARDGIGLPVAMSSSTPLGPDGGLSGVRVDVDVPL